FKRATFADEMIGGLLGIVQGLFLIGAIIIILDSFFQIPTIPISPNEFGWIRSFWEAIDPSTTAQIFRSTLIPGFISVFGLLIPSDLQAFYVTVVPR
ncbi:MAG: hypothetical protein QOI09_1718, partial [Chloroflexota bacterium]|nr:hypothetical protein [Chloroflexota bacterium]